MDSLFNNITPTLQRQEQTLVVNVNVEKEGEIRQIFQDILNHYTPIAVDELSKRVSFLEQAFIRANAIGDPTFMTLSNPAMHSLMRDSVKAAAETGDEKDLNLLGNLLAERKNMEGNKSLCHGIKKAIEAIPYIPEEALLGLTVVSIFVKAFRYYDTYKVTLDKLEAIFNTMPLEKLPQISTWVDDLSMCNAAIPKMGTFKKLEELIYELTSMYMIIGIENNSKVHQNACQSLKNHRLSVDDVFVENELLPGYVRLFFLKENIERIGIVTSNGQKKSLPKEVRDEFLGIFDKYIVDESRIPQIKNEIIRQWDSRPCLKQIHDWWNKNTENLFYPSSIGYILAYVNAKYYYNDINDFIHS